MAQDNLQLNSDFTAQEYSGQQQTFGPAPIPGSVSITSINSVTGPTIDFDGSGIGFLFSPAGSTIILSVSNAPTARTALGAAKSGANDNINTFTALTGNAGWSAWTGASDKTAHATYSGTASVGYVQAELQGVMDKLKQITEAYKALQDVLLGIGITKA